VDDEGPGVPPSERDRIWTPYYRMQRDSETAVGGSGIGLAVVRELIAFQGGRAWVEDAPSGGARIVVELPAERSVPTVMETAPRETLTAIGRGA
jgi:signal transduction histidine kinase